MTMREPEEENGTWAALWREALAALSLGWDLALTARRRILARELFANTG